MKKISVDKLDILGYVSIFLIVLAIIAAFIVNLVQVEAIMKGGAKVTKSESRKIEEMGFETVADWHGDEIDAPYVIVLRHKTTDVMYMHTKRGGLELMVEEDGTPLTYREYKESEK